MPRTAAVIGTAIFFVFVPCVLAGLVPWWISHWEFRLSFRGVELTRFVGAALILAGVVGLVDSFVRFALQGLRCYEYDEILKRDKLSLDLFWIKDQSLTDTDSLPAPDILAAEIADELEAAFDLFTKIAANLPKAVA